MIAFAESLTAPPATAGSSDRAAPSPRFTLDGDDSLERHLERTCAHVLSGVFGVVPARKIEAVLLGGGYGRGEGGVLREGAGDRPYNDLEFYIAIRGNRHFNEFLYQRPLQVLGEILTHIAGVEVEFKITSRAELTRRPISMFSYDLVMGHRMLWSAADVDLLGGCDHHRRADEIPLEEATRLLMNRCTGLLFAGHRLEHEPFTPVVADYVRRNIAKAQLAVGDAMLTARGLYHWSCRERDHRLERIARDDASSWARELLRHHAIGVDFKLHPDTEPVSREQLTERLDQVKALALRGWLWLETRRLCRSFASAREYALDVGEKCAGSSRLRNLLLNARVDGFRPKLGSRPWRHPRERIFRSLALLLWEPASLSDPNMRKTLALNLNSAATNRGEAIRDYEKLWVRVR